MRHMQKDGTTSKTVMTGYKMHRQVAPVPTSLQSIWFLEVHHTPHHSLTESPATSPGFIQIRLMSKQSLMATQFKLTWRNQIRTSLTRLMLQTILTWNLITLPCSFISMLIQSTILMAKSLISKCTASIWLLLAAIIKNHSQLLLASCLTQNCQM